MARRIVRVVDDATAMVCCLGTRLLRSCRKVGVVRAIHRGDGRIGCPAFARPQRLPNGWRDLFQGCGLDLPHALSRDPEHRADLAERMIALLAKPKPEMDDAT